jgi:hypothetical protein
VGARFKSEIKRGTFILSIQSVTAMRHAMDGSYILICHTLSV